MIKSDVNICVQLLNSLLAEEKLGIDGLGALFPVSEVFIKEIFIVAYHVFSVTDNLFCHVLCNSQFWRLGSVVVRASDF